MQAESKWFYKIKSYLLYWRKGFCRLKSNLHFVAPVTFIRAVKY